MKAKKKVRNQSKREVEQIINKDETKGMKQRKGERMRERAREKQGHK
jgi:hypothetical protein